jgi:hypothetical protein
MLVFPTLNGLAYVFSERERVLGMARSMLWMPIVNGGLCAAYLLAFLAFGRVVPSVPLAWGLTAIIVMLFVMLVRLPAVRRGIAPPSQQALAWGATLAGVLLAACAVYLAGRAATLAPDAVTSTFASPLVSVTARNGVKVALFVLCLAVFLTASWLLRLSDSARGILAGLPFVPFGGLVSVAGDGSIDLAVRLDIARHMIVSIWIGPAIAIWFIYAFPRWLVRLPPAAAMPALLAAWVLCGIAVAAASLVLHG